jgi:AraC family transcriptional regulator
MAKLAVNSTPLEVVEAEVRIPAATAQIVHVALPEAMDLVMMDRKDFWLDLNLGRQSRRAEACYSNHWGPRRYEPFGKLFLLPPDETIQVSASSGTCTTLRCYLCPEFIREWFDEGLRWTDDPLSVGLNIFAPNMERALFRLAEELRRPQLAGHVLAELLFIEIGIELTRYFHCARKKEMQPGGLAPWRLRLIEERLRDAKELPTLAELATLCGLSTRRLSQEFRVNRNCSIGTYLVNSRIENAKRLLAGEQSVKSIAYTLGFASPSSFCYAFRRVTGKTPLEFRKAQCLS